MLILLTFLGHPVHGSWVVGVRDEDGKIRAEVVPDRGTVQLTRFIERYVRPGSWLHSDNWRGYANGTSNTQDILGAMGIRGLSVNHEKTFKEWIPEHRKWGCTNSIEGDWNAFIAKTPKRKYGYKNITPYLRQVEWDREANNIWLDWWRALFSCTKEKATQFCLRLNELHSTDPNTPKPTHPLLRMYPRGFHTLRGNNVGSQSSRSKFHYAYCSTSNPNYYGCLKCDFHWGQFCVGSVNLIKEARQAAYLDEKDKAKKKKNKNKNYSGSVCEEDSNKETSTSSSSSNAFTSNDKKVNISLSLTFHSFQPSYFAQSFSCYCHES